MNAAAVGISMCFIALDMGPELPVAPVLPIIAAKLPAIDPERPIADPELPAAAAPPAAKSAAKATMNKRAGRRRPIRSRPRPGLPLLERCVRRPKARQRSRIAAQSRSVETARQGQNLP
jgi:hypothetical protein